MIFETRVDTSPWQVATGRRTTDSVTAEQALQLIDHGGVGIERESFESIGCWERLLGLGAS